tara:strand:+ start:5507 stop:6310 length:804 start_codon:yes stop_codon:yes gene_type:complete
MHNAAWETNTCNGTEYAVSDAQGWFACVAELPTDSTDVIETILSIESGIALLIAAFTLITALFHVLCVYANIRDILYMNKLREGTQPFRWIEYSITYTIMTLCIFQLNQITNINAIVLLIISSVAQMIMGFAIEEINRQRRQHHHSVDPSYTFFQRIIYHPQMIVALLELVACLIMIGHFALIWYNFVSTFQPLLDSPASGMWDELYGYVWLLNIVIFSLYTLFPIIHIVVYFKHEWYTYGEFGYVILSFASKMSLVVIVLLGSMRE